MPRGNKDPNRPKGRMTAYAFFVQASRDKLKQQNPDSGVDFKIFSRQCSESWKGMGEDQKEKFEALAAADKVRYDREMATYVPPPDEGGKKKKAKKDPEAPKRGMSAFLFYCSERRPVLKSENPDWGMSNLSKALGEEWRNMSEDTKRPYEGKAQADKDRYQREMAIYKGKGGRGRHVEEDSD